jgi:hydroxyethylthiazole kinase
METIGELLERVHREHPVVHHLTNWVTIYDCANIVKVFGGSPVMAHAPEEVAEMTSLASSLVLNIGTLTVDFVEAMKLAARSANMKGIPIVLDAVGVGATQFRDRKAIYLLDSAHIDILKGNASEIARIAGKNVRTRGVDAGTVSDDIAELASGLAKSRNSVVAVTGKIDVVAGPSGILKVHNGHGMLTHVVGTGCMAASVIGTFAAVGREDLTFAVAAALSCYGIAAEIAAEKSDGPGSFKERLFDAAYKLDRKTVEQMQRIVT